MARLTRIYLVAGALCLGIGLAVSADLVDSRAYPMLTVALPAGAICLGLFFICYIFEKESAQFDREQRMHLRRRNEAPRNAAAPDHIGCGDHATARR